jgi:hypothetical protein
MGDASSQSHDALGAPQAGMNTVGEDVVGTLLLWLQGAVLQLVLFDDSKTRLVHYMLGTCGVRRGQEQHASHKVVQTQLICFKSGSHAVWCGNRPGVFMTGRHCTLAMLLHVGCICIVQQQ